MSEQESKVRIVVDVDSKDLNDFVRVLGLAEQEAEGAGRALRGMSKDAVALKNGQSGATAGTKNLNTQMAGVATSTKEASASLPRLRYALYDVSQTVAVAAAAMLALSVAPYAVAISFERAFADVRRTVDGTPEALNNLEQEFIKLSQTIPLAFKEIANIGSLAGQLDVPAQDITEFTELVAKFAATTDVSTEASATAFARLSTLLEPLEGGYNALGSSILQVGVNSISTESEIISISTQIAGIAGQAGLTADEVFGLSAAIASVGIQPELARGTVTRLFGNINRAVSQGGVALEDFGRISGQSGDQFSKAWTDAPMQALQDFLEGIGNRSGPEAESALRSLGITSVRDVPAILRLAQNTELLDSNLRDAAEGAREGTELNRQYFIVADTVAEKLKLLNNNFQAFLGTVGDSATNLGFAIDKLNEFLQAMTALAQNPFWSGVAAVSLSLAALAGIFGLLAAGAIRAVASMAALATAQAELGISTVGLSASMKTLIPTILGTGTSAKVATVGVRGLGVAMKALTVVGIALIALEVAKALSDWGRGATDATVKMEETAQGIANVNQNSVALEKALTSIGETDIGALNTFLGIETDAELAQRAVALLGSDVAAFMAKDFAAEGNPLMGFYNFINPTKVELENLEAAFIAAFEAGDKDAAIAEFARLEEGVLAAGGSQDAFNKIMADFIELQDGWVGSEEQKAAAIETTNALLGEETDRILDTIAAFTEMETASVKVQGSLENLGGTLASGGNDWSQYSEAGRANIDALIATMDQLAAQTPGDAQATANNLQALFDVLVAGGHAAASELNILSGAIAGLGGATGFGTVDVASSLTAGFNTATVAARDTASAASSVAEEVRTLIDYANDLSGVFDRAFDIRFSSGTALDAITTQWRDLNEEMAEYRRKVQELTADKSVKEYFLSIANAYGDTLRAGVLRSEIADIDADLADATSGVSKELDGNSKAAIDNRKRVLDLSKGYQDYIVALADSGASQTELNAAVAQSKTDFLAQAQALGYSNQQLQPYIRSFDDMRTAIDRIPRNITVDANTDPAQQAMNEFLAVAKKAASGGINVPIRVTGEITPAAKDALFTQWATKTQQQYGRALAQSASGWAAVRRMWNQGTYGTPYYDGGAVGYTGNGGKYEPKGTVHGGEFVMTKKATQNAGVGNLYGMMNAFERGRGYAGGGHVSTVAPPRSSGSGGPQIVHLSAEDRRLLARAGDVRLFLDGREVAQAGYSNTLVAAERGTN